MIEAASKYDIVKFLPRPERKSAPEGCQVDCMNCGHIGNLYKRDDKLPPAGFEIGEDRYIWCSKYGQKAKNVCVGQESCEKCPDSREWFYEDQPPVPFSPGEQEYYWCNKHQVKLDQFNWPCDDHTKYEAGIPVPLDASLKEPADRVDEAINTLLAFDDVSAAAAFNMVNNTIQTALCTSEGPRKTDQRLYLWDGRRYREAGAAGLEPQIIECVSLFTARYREQLMAITGSDKESEKDRDRLRNKIKMISSFLNTQRRRNVEQTIRTLKMQDARDIGLDADHTKINLQNGVYDLINHKLIDHDPSQRFTRVTSFKYDPEALAPMFKAHLEYVLPDPATRDYFLEVIASSLLRSRREELVFFLWGRTAGNGKSELMRMIITALGEYATWLDPHTFTNKRAANSTQPETLMAIGKAIAAVDEPSKDDMDTSAFKNTANYADVVLRGLYQASKIERWTATSIMLCNTLPPLDSKDAGAARRPVVIPFTKQITEDMKKEDKRPAGSETMRYGEYVGKAEADGIFKILVEALKRHKARNCLLPKMSGEMIEATNEYVYKSNHVARYVAERFTKDAGAVVNAAEFHEDFKKYCIDELGHDSKKIMLPASIKDAMAALGFEYKQVCDKRTHRDNERCYIGIRSTEPANLRKDITTFLRLCHPIKEATTEQITAHFSSIKREMLDATLKQMKEIGAILDLGNERWGHIPP